MDLKRMQQIIVDKDNKKKESKKQEPAPKSKKVKDTGLSTYEGGKEKTPTGKSNAFSESGLTEEKLSQYASKYGLPTTSNKEFQQAQLDLLQKSPEGQEVIKGMIQKYGMPKAGTLADDILGARTFELMDAVEKLSAKQEQKSQPVKAEQPKAEEPKKTSYSFTWRDSNEESGQKTHYFKDKASYDEALKQQMATNRGFMGSTKTGQGSREKGASALFRNNPFVNIK